MPPFVYAATDILAQAVTAAGSLDQNKIAQYIHKTTFKTGKLEYPYSTAKR